jgi:hypothetical protein
MRHAREDYNRIGDLIQKIPEDEPVFLIRGKDIVAPEVIRQWAWRAHEVGADEEIVMRALEWARHVEEWQTENERIDIPDLPSDDAEADTG